MLKRREFIQLTGMAGAIAEVGLVSDSIGLAESPPTPGVRASASRSLPAQLEEIAREFVTIPEREGLFLSRLVKLTRAKRVLELGTAYGYTTIWLALALEETDGTLTSIEIVPERIALAKQHVAQVGLSHRVQFMQGDAHDMVPTLEGAFNLAYLDADKDGNLDYLNALLPCKPEAGSLLVAHNAILLADSMKEYLAQVQNDAGLDTVIVRAVEEDGMALSYRRRSRA